LCEAKKILAIPLAVALLWGPSTATGTEPASIPDVDEVYPVFREWSGVRVLHIGDSNVAAGFTARLGQLVRGAGGSYQVSSWVGSRSKSWVTSGRLRTLLDEGAPHVVLVTLGTNSMKSSRPDLEAPWIRSLVRQIGPRRCFWTGPPPLLEDLHGYNEMAKEAATPCRYFDTRVMGFAPREDGKFHLTRHQGESWAMRVWSWMSTETGDDAL